jgi:hypothetical protein
MRTGPAHITPFSRQRSSRPSSLRPGSRGRQAHPPSGGRCEALSGSACTAAPSRRAGLRNALPAAPCTRTAGPPVDRRSGPARASGPHPRPRESRTRRLSLSPSAPAGVSAERAAAVAKGRGARPVILSARKSGRTGQVRDACDAAALRHSIIVALTLTAYLPSASLSERVVAVARFPRYAWRAWIVAPPADDRKARGPAPLQPGLRVVLSGATTSGPWPAAGVASWACSCRWPCWPSGHRRR